MRPLWQDFNYAARMLRARPGFTLAAVLSLALGVGACTSIFSVIDAVLLRALPYPEAERIVRVEEVNGDGSNMPVTEPNYVDVRARNHSLEAVAEYGSYPVTVVGGSEPARVVSCAASGDFFRVFGTSPIVGRTFLPEESRPGGAAVALVSYGFWKRQLGGRADLDGVTLRVGGRSCSVVGVMPQGFGYPRNAEVWLPRELFPPDTSRTAHNWSVVGRLRAGVTPEQAREELAGVAAQLKQEHGQGTDAAGFAVTPLQEHLVGKTRRALLVILAAVGFLLLVACTNVANLLLAQMTGRRSEMAVRVALGAGRLRLARQFVTENLLLALAGGVLGVLLAFWGVDLLLALNQGALPRADEIGVNARALAFTLGLSLLVAVGLGLAAVLHVSGEDVQSGLRGGSRGQSASPERARLRGLLVVAQVALTMLLLVGAGLLGRSFLRLLEVEPGFRPEGVVAMSMSLDASEGKEMKAAQFYRQLLERVEALPGVVAVGGTNSIPLTGTGSNGLFLIENDPAKQGDAEYRRTSAGYFAAMGIPLLRGRLFGPGDTPEAPPAAVVSQSLAQKYFPGEDPLGRHIQFGNMDGDKRLLEIVGVVGDVRERGLDASPSRTIYANAFQRPQSSSLAVVVRAQGDASQLVPAMREAARSLDPEVPATFRPLEQVYSSSLDQRRFSLVVFGVFAAGALLLAALGLYGVVAYTVRQRTHEIGIRMALGARGRDIIAQVLRRGMGLAVAGILIGFGASLGLTRVLSGLLYDVGANDPTTFAFVALLLGLVALLACLVPAWRASKVEPMEALRHE
jgi:putative ABC transport system permease protein